jgi:putative oxidoreductase
MSILNFVMAPVERFGAPLGRLFIALIFVMSGLNKMGSYTNVAGWMEAMGVPGALLPLVIALEVLGGAAIIIGWQTRFVALLLAGFCLMSALIFHANFADQNEMIHFMKNVALTGGFLFLVANGGGNYAVDNLTKSA